MYAAHHVALHNLAVSTICLGTGGFGTQIDRGQAWAMLDAYVERGGNFLDTARCYGDWVPTIERSISEKFIGAWLSERALAGRMIVATKGAHPDLRGDKLPRVSRQAIADDLNDSLTDLQLARIDLYYLHRDDPSVPVADVLGWLEEHVRSGKLRYYAASNWSPQRLWQAQQFAAEIA